MDLNDKKQLFLILMGGLFGIGYLATHHLLLFTAFFVCQVILLINSARKQMVVGSVLKKQNVPDGDYSTEDSVFEDSSKNEILVVDLEQEAGSKVGPIEQKASFGSGSEGALAVPATAELIGEVDALSEECILYTRDTLFVKDLKHILENISLRISENRLDQRKLNLEMSDDLIALFDELELAFEVPADGRADIIDVDDYVSEVDDIIQAYISLVIHLSQQSSDAVDRIQKMTKQIDTIFTVVEDVQSIADKTSLVALNAAIEAARSGQVGRSYAFVAKEVQKLSQHSDKFSFEIKKEMARAKKSVAATSEIVDTIAISDVEVAIATKSFIDQSLGRLKEILDWSNEASFTTSGSDVKAAHKDRMRATIGDIQRLLAVVHVKINLLRKVDILSKTGKVNLNNLSEKVNSLLLNKVSAKKKYR